MSKPRVYIDSCCIIDVVKQELRSSLPQGREREVVFTKLLLEAARDDEIDAFTSILSVTECLHVDGRIDEPVTSRFAAFLNSGRYLKLISPTPFTAERGRDLKWKYNVNIPGNGVDYQLIASALDTECSEFITTDEKGPHKEKSKLAIMGLRVVMPSETASLSAERRQMSLLKPPVVEISQGKRKKKATPKANR